MQTLYIILLILLTVIINVTITLLMPYVKQYWNVLIQRVKRVLKRKPQPIIDATQYIELSTRLDDYDKQLNNLAKRVKTVNEGNRELIRKTVREYLEELKSK